MSRVLVVGASGFIGHFLVEELLGNTQHRISGTFNNIEVQQEGCRWYRADITNVQQIGEVFRQVEPEIVVVLAAMADVGECEREPNKATQVNVTGTQNVVRLCGLHQSRLVYLSTEYVFDGQSGNYKEDATPSPTTHYGKTKWEAERAVAKYEGPWCIVRTSLVYGWHPRSGRANLVTRVANNLDQNRPAFGFTDQFRSPVHVKDLAQGITRVMHEDYTGVAHLGGPDWVGMDQFVLAIAEQFGLNADLVQQVPSTDRRPSLLGLDSTATVTRLGIQFKDMNSGLKEMQTNRRESP